MKALKSFFGVKPNIFYYDFFGSKGRRVVYKTVIW